VGVNIEISVSAIWFWMRCGFDFGCGWSLAERDLRGASRGAVGAFEGCVCGWFWVWFWLWFWFWFEAYLLLLRGMVAGEKLLVSSEGLRVAAFAATRAVVPVEILLVRGTHGYFVVAEFISGCDDALVWNAVCWARPMKCYLFGASSVQTLHHAREYGVLQTGVNRRPIRVRGGDGLSFLRIAAIFVGSVARLICKYSAEAILSPLSHAFSMLATTKRLASSTLLPAAKLLRATLPVFQRDLFH
jgi:hypothetical protein